MRRRFGLFARPTTGAKLCDPGTHRTPAEYAACKTCVFASKAGDTYTQAAVANLTASGGPIDWDRFKEAQRADFVRKQIARHAHTRESTLPRKRNPASVASASRPCNVNVFATVHLNGATRRVEIDQSGATFGARWSYGQGAAGSRGSALFAQECLHSSGAVENDYQYITG